MHKDRELEKLKEEVESLQSRVSTLESHIDEKEIVEPETEEEVSSDTDNTPKRNFSLPDIELEFGMRLLGYAGGLALVIASLFLVQLAISAGYIGPLARVILASLVGVGLFVGGRYATVDYNLSLWGRIVTGTGGLIAYIAIYGSYGSSAYREAIGTPFWLVLGLLTLLVCVFAIDSVSRDEYALTTEAFMLVWVTVGVTLHMESQLLLGSFLSAALVGVLLTGRNKESWTLVPIVSLLPSYIVVYILTEELLTLSSTALQTVFFLGVFAIFVVSTELRRSMDPKMLENKFTTTNSIPLFNTLFAVSIIALLFQGLTATMGFLTLPLSVGLVGSMYMAHKSERCLGIEPFLFFFTLAVALTAIGDDFLRIAGLSIAIVAALTIGQKLKTEWIKVASHTVTSVLFLDAVRVVYLGGSFSILPFQNSTTYAGIFFIQALLYYYLFSVKTSLIDISNMFSISAERVSHTYGWAGTAMVTLFLEVVFSGVLLSVVWGCLGFIVITIGAIKNVPKFRMQGMALLSLTTLKVFIFDTAGLDPIPRIISFIVVGAILLLTSYLYAKTQADIDIPYIN